MLPPEHETDLTDVAPVPTTGNAEDTNLRHRVQTLYQCRCGCAFRRGSMDACWQCGWPAGMTPRGDVA